MGQKLHIHILINKQYFNNIFVYCKYNKIRKEIFYYFKKNNLSIIFLIIYIRNDYPNPNYMPIITVYKQLMVKKISFILN